MGRRTEIRLGDSVELDFNGKIITIGLLATTKAKAALNIEAPQDVKIRDIKNGSKAASRAIINARAKKKNLWELNQSSFNKSGKCSDYEAGLKVLKDQVLIKIETNSPEEEIAVAKELVARGLM